MNNEYFRRIVDSALDAIITIDASGRVLGFNRAAEQIFGHTQKAAIGRDLAELIIPPRLREAHRNGLKRLAESGVARILDKRIELVAMRVDGNEFPVELTVTQVPGPGPVTFAGYVRDISERLRARRAYRELIDAAPVGIYRAQEDGRILTANPALARMLGAETPDQLVGHNILEYYAEPAERTTLVDRFDAADDSVARLSVTWKRRDKRLVHVEVDARRVQGESGPEFLVFARDVSERFDLEQRLHQSQKMDAVGRLAGGIAHDFNNILTAIIGHADLMRAGLESGGVSADDIDQVKKAALRAAELTQQLLAFGRKQLLAPRVLDLGVVLAGLEPMLRRLIDPAVSVVTHVEPDLGRVAADPSRIEQVIMNLVLNARDAMPDGGTLTIELSNEDLAMPERHGLFSVPAGRHVVLTVRDTGVGMDEQTMALIFDPFFTTKEQGAGSGLGLSTVYGVVKQSGGYLVVSSETGRGSTFRIYLPRVEAPADPPAPASRRSDPKVTGETIMVVEDEPAVRSLLQRALARAGFTVLAAEDGASARALSARHEGTIDLLLTDVVMPGGSGRALADDLVAARPGLKVIYMSGYTDDVIARERVRDPGVAFLQKPFSAADATALIREVLASGSPTA